MPVGLSTAVLNRVFAAMNVREMTVAALCLAVCSTSLLIVTTAASSDPVKCLTPNSTEGLCINLDSCSSIYEVSNADNKTITLDTLLYLVFSQCGFNGTTPKVCCPLTDPVDSNSLTTTTDTNFVISEVLKDAENEPIIIDEPVKCVTPNATEGLCINLQSCPSLYEVSSDYNRTLTLETLTFLIHSQCGFNGTNPKVCCPFTDSAVDSLYNNKAESKPTTDSNSVNPEVEKVVEQQPPNVIDEPCLTPNATQGLCIQLESCPAIYNISSDYESKITLETMLYLKNSLCGFIGSKPKVCCAPVV